MTEEIIIDGVDVAGCIFFDKNNGYNICCCDDIREDKIPFANFCQENKECYYKQLKQAENTINECHKYQAKLEDKIDSLEQENNSLQAQLNNITVQSNNAITALEQENKDLKKQIRLYDCIDKWGTKQCHCACRCLGNEFCEDADKKINTYRSVLEEINRTLLGVHGLSINCNKQIIKVRSIINEVLK